jgi:UDP-N-acetylmuramoylalanine-D-glutamate ligase
VEASVALVSQVAKSPVLITVTATAGKSSVTAQVTVEIPAEYLMEFF